MQSIAKKTGISEVQYLSSTVGVKKVSHTVDHDTVLTVDGEGNKYLQRGVVMAKITDSGKIGPYLSTADDGRQLDANIVGINDTFAYCQDGDVEVGTTVECTAKLANVVMDGEAITTALAAKLISRTLDIKFDA